MTGQWPTPQMQYMWESGQIPFAPNYPDFPIPGFPTPYDPWGAAQITPEQELEILKGQAKAAEEELNRIRERIKELEATNNLKK
jgi:hypothetical protein